MSTLTATSTQNPDLRTPASVIWGILGVSAVASLFLAWLVYYHPPTDVAGTHLAFLPALNSVLNALCTVFLLIGFRHIRRREVVKHRNSMFAAFIVSSVFLVTYIVNHILHGDMLFPRTHPIARAIYLWVLLTPHIFAATVCLPLILITFFLSLTGRFPAHRRIARWTFPIWLYVSISGVVVYAMLSAYRQMQQDTRKLLTTGSIILSAGVLCVALMFGLFGGATRQGPHTNGGWLMLILALGCLPMGLLISALGLAKLIGERTRG